jgi:hypothetical protein
VCCDVGKAKWLSGTERNNPELALDFHTLAAERQ